MSTDVFGVILDQFSYIDDAPYVRGADHPVRARHLSHSMRQEKDTLYGRFADLVEDLLRHSFFPFRIQPPAPCGPREFSTDTASQGR